MWIARTGSPWRDLPERYPRACLVNKPVKKYSINRYFMLASGEEEYLHTVVNQHKRFVLNDGDWDGLKKLRPTGTLWSGRSDVAAGAMTTPCV